MKKKYRLASCAWYLVKEYSGIYNIPDLNYAMIKKIANISFIIHNFKKYNDKENKSPIKDLNLYGCTENSIIYKTIASGYKSKIFYQVLAYMLQPNPIPTSEIKAAFYKNPSLFVYRKIDGSMPSYTGNYRFKFWTHAYEHCKTWFLENQTNGKHIYFHFKKLDPIDQMLFTYGRWVAPH